MSVHIDKIRVYSEEEATAKGWVNWEKLSPEAKQLYGSPGALSSLPRNCVLKQGWYEKSGEYAGVNMEDLLVTSINKGSESGYPYFSNKAQGPKKVFTSPAVRANKGYNQERVGLFVPHAQGPHFPVRDHDNNPIFYIDPDGEKKPLEMPVIADLSQEIAPPGMPTIKKESPLKALYRLPCSDRDVAENYGTQEASQELTFSRMTRTMLLILLGLDFFIVQWKVQHASDLNKGTKIREALAQVADMSRPRDGDTAEIDWEDLDKKEQTEFVLLALEQDRLNYFKTTGKTIVWNPTIQLRAAKVFNKATGKWEKAKDKYKNGNMFAEFTAPLFSYLNERKGGQVTLPNASELGFDPVVIESIHQAVPRRFHHIPLHCSKDPTKVLGAEDRARIEMGNSYVFSVFNLNPKTDEYGKCRSKLHLKALQLFYHGEMDAEKSARKENVSSLFVPNTMHNNLLEESLPKKRKGVEEGGDSPKRRKVDSDLSENL